jgi:hypothetical protein
MRDKRCGTEMRDEITPKLVRTTAPSSGSTGRSSICAWTDSEKGQKGSKEKLACSWADSERFLGPGFRPVSGRCSWLSSARVNSAEPSGRPLNVLSRRRTPLRGRVGRKRRRQVSVPKTCRSSSNNGQESQQHTRHGDDVYPSSFLTSSARRFR